jgi:hypothetical protein
MKQKHGKYLYQYQHQAVRRGHRGKRMRRVKVCVIKNKMEETENCKEDVTGTVEIVSTRGKNR